MNENLRLIIVAILATIILMVYNYIVVQPYQEQLAEYQQAVEAQNITNDDNKQKLAPPVQEVKTFVKREEVRFENDYIKGSINLRGARIDSLHLKRYLENLENDEMIHLFEPESAERTYFTELGWLNARGSAAVLPDKNTKWQVKEADDHNILLEWNNGNNVLFQVRYKLDDLYGIFITQEVINNSGQDINIQPYYLLNRKQSSLDRDQGMLIHEGGIGVFDGILSEHGYDDMLEKAEVAGNTQFSWAGFSDKYWLTALFPKAPSANIKQTSFTGYNKSGETRYQVDILGELNEISNGSRISNEMILYAGVKDLDYIERYEQNYNLQLFDRAVDFGMLYFITKPIFIFLHKIYNFIGNFGLAIIILTVVIKLLLLPLSVKGFRSMNKLKDLSPKMMEIKEKHQGDNMRLQQEMMNLYKKEKVNPVSGCLPIILQIPIFFALYKVLYVTIEMRHAPFYWWITDLSAKDPTNIFTLFGLVEWDAPSFLHIGVLPILMSLTMYIQQKLNPTPTDPTQAQVLKLLPFIFLFLFASFPSGLLLYWVVSNILSITQQQFVRAYIK